MADENEVFRNLEDSSGEGIAHVGKAPADAQSTDIQAPVLPAVDTAGDLQNIPLRDEGDSATGQDAVPGLVAKDSSGNLTFLTLDANGKLPVSEDAPGTVIQDLGNSVAGVVGVQTLVASAILNTSEDYICSLGSAACTKPVKWELVQLDDVTSTILETKITGPGDFNCKFELKQEFSSGASGNQQLRIFGTQLRGPSSDMYASVKVIEKA